MKKYVILQGVGEDNWWCRFFTTSNKDVDHTRLADGTVAYKIIGYADSVGEAQTFLYGKTFPLPGHDEKELWKI